MKSIKKQDAPSIHITGKFKNLFKHGLRLKILRLKICFQTKNSLIKILKIEKRDRNKNKFKIYMIFYR